MKRALLTCVLAFPWAAQALEQPLAEGRLLLEEHGFYKAVGSGLWLPEGLVRQTQALEALVEEARLALPPEQASLLSPSPALPRFGATTTHTGRLWGRGIWDERLELAVAWQVAGSLASHSTLTQSSGLSGVMTRAEVDAARRRVWDFDPVLARGDTGLAVHNLDQLSLKLMLPSVELAVGRQVLSWGTGRFWNPTDLLSPFGPTDIDREVRRGVDALRVSVPLGPVGMVDLLWLPQPRAADQSLVLRGQTNVRGFDLSLSAAKYVSDVVVGADFSGDAGPLGVHGEAAYTWGLSGLEEGAWRVQERFLRAVAGVEARPSESVFLSCEYYFNGFGAARPSGYVEKLRGDRISRGEIFGAGRHYVGLSASWQLDDLLGVQATAIANVGDPSAMLLPTIDYWIAQSVLLRAGAYVPVGRPPDPSGLSSLTVGDLLTRSEAFSTATRSLGLRSEFGASPMGLFAQLGVYF